MARLSYWSWVDVTGQIPLHGPLGATHIHVRCTQSFDYHTVGGVYIIPKPAS